MTSPRKPSIDKFESCTFNINIFCGNQSTIAKLNENWSLSDRGTNRHYLHCSCTIGHFSYIVVSTTSFFIEPVWKILSSFIDEVCTKLDFEQLFLLPFGLETSDRRKPAKCLSPLREGNKIIYVFVGCFLVWLGRSVWENLDLDRWCRLHCVRSVLATSVKILPYRPPTRLIRANYWVKTEKSSVIPRFSLYRGSWCLGSTVFIN